MLDAKAVAEFFLYLDTDGSLFSKDRLIEREGRTFYEGNARLNKLLHLAQNIYIAKTGKPLMDTTFYAYDNGAVIPDIQKKYSLMLGHRSKPSIPEEEEKFLRVFFQAFKNADVDELIELSHEDAAWREKHMFWSKKDQMMDTMAHADEYRQQYKDIVEVLDRMGAA